MHYRYGRAMNMQYLSGDSFRDIAIDTAPLVLMSFGKSIDQVEEPDAVHRPEGTQYYQLVYIAKGEMEFVLDGTPTICGANTLVLFRPGQPQIHRVVPNSYAVRYFFNFSGSKVEQILQKYGICDQVITFSEPFAWCEQFHNHMDNVHQTMFKEDVCNDLLLALLGIIGGALRARYPANPSKFAELLHIMQTNCTKDIPVTKYAEMLGFNEKYFISFFKKATGHTPHQYITIQRMNLAKRLLISSKLTVRQIALHVGYTDTRYFSRLFISFFSQTPSEFRKQNAKK